MEKEASIYRKETEKVKQSSANTSPYKIVSTKSSKFVEGVALLFAIRAITFVWLAFSAGGYMPLYEKLILIIRYSTILIGPLYLAYQGKLEKKNNVILIPLLYYFLMLVLNTYGGYEGSYIHELVSISVFIFMSDKMKMRVFHYFYKIILYSCAIAILLYPAILLGLPIGFETVPFVNDGVETSVYLKWFIFGIVGDGQWGLPRLCGIFNEPGGLGTVCALLYVATYSYSKLYEKIILLLAIILSFSVAGFLLVFVFYALHYIRKGWKYFIPLGLLVAFVLIAPTIDWGDEFVNNFVARFEITDEGIAGDDRVKPEFEKLYNEVWNSNDVFLGKGATYGNDMGTSSYKNLIIQFGVFGFGLYFILWLFAMLSTTKKNRDCLILLLLFIISLYQRPVPITSSYGYVLLIGGFLTIRYWRINGFKNELINTKKALR